ncbi:MAG TPA: phosphotransferase [Pyrinomonadaceae bacterium]|jgi:Ser/Thr protein kinase RdoA (MazF antagonist)|nr:phosphotransferase [Pyrinomonadaceae bacterium]
MSGNRPRKFSEAKLREIIKLWNGDEDSLEFLGGSNNTLYSFKAGGKGLVLRLSKISYRTESKIQAELDWIKYLARKGVSVCPPVPSGNDKLIETVRRPRQGVSLATVFIKAAGKPVDPRNRTIWNTTLFQKWGRTLGRIHKHSKSFKCRAGYRPPDLDGDAIISLAQRTLPKAEREARKLLETYWQEISNLPKDRESYGLIHGDLNRCNFVYGNGRLTVFDFDDSSYFWYIYDITVILYVTFLVVQDLGIRKRRAIVKNFFSHFMFGYQAENHLGREWIERLPQFLNFFDVLVFMSFFQKGHVKTDSDLVKYARTNLGNNDRWSCLDFGRLYDKVLKERKTARLVKKSTAKGR